MPFIGLLIVMNLLYGGAPTFLKLAGAELPAYSIVFLRHTIALFCFLPIFLFSKHKKITVRDFTVIMFGALLTFTLTSILQVMAMKISSATDGAFIMAMEPLGVIFLAMIFLKEKIDPKMLGGLALALIGFIVLSGNSLQDSQAHSGRWMGNLFFLTATMAEAAFPILLKPLLKRYPPLTIAFYSLLCSSLYMLPFQGTHLVESLTVAGWRSISAVIYLGVGCSFLACFMWLTCLSRLSASFVAISWFLQPLFGCFFATGFLQEPITATTISGGAFVFAALGMLTLQNRTLKPMPSIRRPSPHAVFVSPQHLQIRQYTLPNLHLPDPIFLTHKLQEKWDAQRFLH